MAHAERGPNLESSKGALPYSPGEPQTVQRTLKKVTQPQPSPGEAVMLPVLLGVALPSHTDPQTLGWSPGVLTGTPVGIKDPV